MNAITLITLSPDELQQLIASAVSQVLSTHSNTAHSSKLLLTTKEVCERIGYKPVTINSFIRDGRRTRKGSIARLPAVEITNGEYRIRPDDLADWIMKF